MLRVPNRRTLQGKRDYALLKTMFASGLRSAELCNLWYLHTISYTITLGVSMVQFRLEMPEDLHRALKVACAVEGVAMREKVTELIRQYIEKQERKKAKK